MSALTEHQPWTLNLTVLELYEYNFTWSAWPDFICNPFLPFLKSNITEIIRCQILNTNTFGIGIRAVKSWKFHSLKSFKTQTAPNSMKSQSDFDVTCTILKHLYVKQLESCFVRISCKPWITEGFQLGGANRK